MKSLMRRKMRARGTEEFWVPAAISAIGAGAEAVNQKNANNRAQGVETQNLLQQQQLEQQANNGAKQLTKQIANDSPAAAANKSTGEFVKQLRNNEAGAATQGSDTTSTDNNFGQSTSALPSSTIGSSRFKQGNADSQTQTQAYGSDLAKTMGAINAPVLERQQEGIGMQNYATGLNLLGGQSQGENFVNQLRAEAAGQANPYVSAIAGVAVKGANAYSKNAGGSTTPVSTYTTPGQVYGVGAGDPNAYNFGGGTLGQSLAG